MDNEEIHARLTAVEEKADRVLAIAENCETLIRTLVTEVKPTIDAVMSSPLAKMLGGKRK